MREHPYGPELARVFELAGVEYSRVDFGLVGGKPQIYEINTNPEAVFGDDHPSPIHRESFRLFEHNRLEALRSIDTPDSDQIVSIAGD